MSTQRATVPASFFGIVLGLVGLGDCWRVAALAWGLPSSIGEAIMLGAFGVWILLSVLYLLKWLTSSAEALAEWRHPVQSCFVGLAPVATLLAGIAIAPHLHILAVWLIVIGAVAQLLYGIYFTAQLWSSEREIGTASPALYLPTVAGNFVTAFCAGYLGRPDVGTLFLGAGMLSWLSLESIISNRLSFHVAIPIPLRPTMGIMLAPPAVGCVGYLFVTGGISGGAPDLVAQLLVGYALLLLGLLARLMPWVVHQPFTAGYWAFSFGITALAFDTIVFVIRGLRGGLMEWLSIGLLIFATTVIVALIIGTVRLLVRGKLLPPPLISSV